MSYPTCFAKCGRDAKVLWTWQTSRGPQMAEFCSDCARIAWKKWGGTICQIAFSVDRLVTPGYAYSGKYPDYDSGDGGYDGS